MSIEQFQEIAFHQYSLENYDSVPWFGDVPTTEDFPRITEAIWHFISLDWQSQCRIYAVASVSTHNCLKDSSVEIFIA